MTYRIRNIVIAVGLALVAMMLTLFYVTNYKRSVTQNEADVPVYVAAHDLAAGASGSDLVRHKALKLTQVSKKAVVPGAISNPEQIQTLVLSGPIYAGEQVTMRRFTDVAAQGIRAQLRGTMRAVQVPGDANQLLAGTLHAGDHVDVVGNLRVNPDTEEHATRIVLRDLTVLAGAAESTTARVSPASGTSVILAVTDTQVQRLFYVMKNADWSFELRPVLDAADSPDRLDTIATVMGKVQ
jgi:Flp pilus assembly protein CpaB